MLHLKHGVEVPPVLGLYTDGGLDHNPTHSSVQLALITVFRKLNLDSLIAVCTAPGGSFINPVECIMSLLNLAMQGVALERKKVGDSVEKILQSCNSMSDIRAAAVKNKEVEEAYIDSIQPVLTLLCERFSRVKLKEEPMVARCTTASDEQLTELFAELHTIDPALMQDLTQKKTLEIKADLQAFLKTHAWLGHYVFQLRKCSGCSVWTPYRLPEEVLNDDGVLPWLPDPIWSSQEDTEYLPFNEEIEQETTESFRPPLREAMLDEDRTSDAQHKDILISAKVRTTVSCIACDKPRCVYSKYALTPSAIAWVKTVAEEILYVCGSPLSTDPQAPWVVRRALMCESPVEITYYGSKKFSNIC